MVQRIAQDLAHVGSESESISYPWWNRVLGEARTRVLLTYIGLQFVVAAMSIPIFTTLFFAEVDRRVQDDLTEEMEVFQDAYEVWEATPDHSLGKLKQFTTQFLSEKTPEDDNFLIVILDNQYYKSSPRALPAILDADSDLMRQWSTLSQPNQGRLTTSDPNIGNVIYLTQPLVLDNQVRGAFVVAHLTWGERREALAGVYIFAQLAIAVVLISLLLAWFAIGKLLLPVQKLAAATRSISEADLSQRLSVRGSGELADLANTFNSMMDRLQEAFVSQRNFINDAGHELRTPITIIQGHLEVMGDDPEEQQASLEVVMDELGRMSRIVNDLLLLAKAERIDFLQLQPIHVRQLIEEIYGKAQTLADRNWQIKTEAEGQMMGDRQRLTGAILNLIQNAVQHTYVGNLIELGSTVTQTEVRLWVRDAGEGIPPSEQRRIFERFTRMSDRFRRSEGAGLGLAIVRAVVEAHGGRVELTSQVGMGSTFTLVLPLEPPSIDFSPGDG